MADEEVENAAWSEWFEHAQPFDGVEEAFRAGFQAARRLSETMNGENDDRFD